MRLYTSKLTRTIWFDLFIIAITLGIFYSLLLGSFALIPPDEARYSEIAREMLALRDFITPHLNYVIYLEKPPLFFWLQSLSIAIFGLSEWALRLCPALLAVTGCLMTYLAGRKLYNRATGIYACFILATCLLYFAMGHLISLDMAVSTFITITLFLFLIGTIETSTSKQRLYIWGAFAFAALAVMTKGLIGLLFPCLIVGTWVLLLNKWNQLKYWHLPSAIFIFLLIALPWHVLVQLKNPAFFHFYFIEQQFLRYSTLAAERFEPVYYFIFILFAGFVPWTIFLAPSIRHAWPKWRERQEKQIDIFLLLWVFIILIFFSLSKSKLIPYILPIFPPLAILVGRYFADFQHKFTKRFQSNLLQLFLSAALLGILFYTMKHYHLEIPNLPPDQFILSIIFTLSITTLLAYAVYRLLGFKLSFAILNIGIACCYLIALLMIPSINTRTIKPLVPTIIKIKKADDLLIMQKHYYQDLPFYLQQRIVLSSCSSELNFGQQFTDTKKWFINRKQFIRLWQSKQRILAVSRIFDYERWHARHSNLATHIIAKTKRNVLYSNH